ncbi:MAG: VIT1/CCC1 transporter family protein [candidate division NC10 bacterium]|nr:VIT1/CCC1 transporter family protein [candidate division NC10 bacterium]
MGLPSNPANGGMDSLAAKRERIQRKGRIREVVFGMQDGLITTVGFVAGLHGATADNTLVLLGGFVELLAGAFSMAAGGYLSTKAEREVLEREVLEERRRFQEEPYLAHDDLRKALEEEGLSKERAYRIVKLLQEGEEAFFKTFQEKVLGLGDTEIRQPLIDALVLGLSFAVGAFIPLLPYLLFSEFTSLWVAVVLSGLSLFGVGAAKAYLAEKRFFRSGLEFFAIAMGAAAVGYLFGLLLPGR